MSKTTFLEGKLLLAMPSMTDPRFERTVIYVCSHSDKGAMGLVINNLVPNLDFPQLLEQLEIETECKVPEIPIHAGGPVETGRGFVLHSADYVQESTLIVSETVAVTATVDILKAIAQKGGPSNHLLILGYSGWGPGQIEGELQSNSWLSADADDEILFRTGVEDKWPRAMAMIGVDITMLSSQAGSA